MIPATRNRGCHARHPGTTSAAALSHGVPSEGVTAIDSPNGTIRVCRRHGRRAVPLTVRRRKRVSNCHVAVRPGIARPYWQVRSL